jgi:hypothetical protein
MKRLIKGIVKGLLLEMMEGESSKKAAIDELNAYFNSFKEDYNPLVTSPRQDARITIAKSIEILMHKPEAKNSNPIFQEVKKILDNNGLLNRESFNLLRDIIDLYEIEDWKDDELRAAKAEQMKETEIKDEELLGKGF